ncbi:MAG: response regulator [Bacteroidia bacterium]|nr:response regulator [Bacteroidia bacterium]MDW8159672.1 response regulator [Bacteroidia bacterium]
MAVEKTILHVEDDLHYQMLCKKIFEKLGFVYTGVPTAERAEEILNQEKIDILLVDCFLHSEGINGDKLIENLLNTNKFQNPIIYVSNSARPAFIKKLKKDYPSAKITECVKQDFLPMLNQLSQTNEQPSPDYLFEFLDTAYSTEHS